MPALQTRCRYHPDRAGLGVCSGCGATVCEECATRVEGILHCRECLRLLSAGPTGVGWRSTGSLLPAVLLTPLVWALLSFGLQALVVSFALVRKLLSEP